MSESLTKLLGHTLIIVAHPDDEAVGAGILIQRMEQAGVVFCTDGGPQDPYFWQAYGTQEHYVEVRRKEAQEAGKIAGIKRIAHLPFRDQELFKNLASAYKQLEQFLHEFQPNAILTHSYEGGHPDHDSCAFLSSVLGSRHSLPIWEMPLYFRTEEGPQHQRFLGDGEGLSLPEIKEQELDIKHKMVSAYASQGGILESFGLAVERFRPMATYDFSRPPAEVINYEVWQWPIKATEVCAAFTEFLSQLGLVGLATHRTLTQ